MPVIVVATIYPAREFRADILALLGRTVEAVHGMDGCELYALHETHDRFVLIERWSDFGALEAHRSTPALAELSAGLSGRMAAPIDVQILRALPAGDPGKGTVRRVNS